MIYPKVVALYPGETAGCIIKNQNKLKSMDGLHVSMRVMALDVGDKKIGIAVSDSMRLTAQGRTTLRRTDVLSDIEKLRQLVEENEVYEIIVGRPLHMDGRESIQSQKIARFAEQLGKALKTPITYRDERLTSFAAEQYLEEMGLNWRKRREQVDKIAAMIILQDYLDSLPKANPTANE